MLLSVRGTSRSRERSTRWCQRRRRRIGKVADVHAASDGEREMLIEKERAAIGQSRAASHRPTPRYVGERRSDIGFAGGSTERTSSGLRRDACVVAKDTSQSSGDSPPRTTRMCVCMYAMGRKASTTTLSFIYS